MIFDNTELFILPEGIESRWASPENPKGEKGKAAQAKGGRKGFANFPLKAGEQFVLAEEVRVSGMVRRIWATCENKPEYLRGLRLDFYWDGAVKPAISAPLGDFFGTGLGRLAAFQSFLFSSPEGRSFNCFVPMPFKTGMKIVLTNESGFDLKEFFYDIDYTVGDVHKDGALYLHACYHRENPTEMRKDYEILPQISGKGRFLGANFGVKVNSEYYFKSWWGEGECKIFLDGDRDFPTLCGTGTEDYIGTGWGQGRYDHLYQGCHVADDEKMEYCFYRYHILEPVYFKKDIRVTIQQIGCWDPHHKRKFHEAGRQIISAWENQPLDFSDESKTEPYGMFERQDDWSSCAYFYLDCPENSLPPLVPAEERVK